jgi:small basic protein (TIGR04137 family)
MSIHPSLSSSEKNKKQRSVLKRTERLRMMMDKGQWQEGDDVYRLPKIKTVRIKIKKEKAAEKPEAVAQEAVAPAATAEPTTKGPATAKAQEKK